MELDAKSLGTNHGKEGLKRRGMVQQMLVEFTSTSTLHGLHYISDRGRSKLEKIFWGIITVLSAALCVWACARTWMKWQDRPIIISVNDHLMAATEVPFPAVTICPQAKQKSFNFTEQYVNVLKNFTDKPREWWFAHRQQAKKRMKSYMKHNPVVKLLSATNRVCHDRGSDPYFFLFLDEEDQNFVQHIIEEAPTIQELLLRHRWREQKIPRQQIDEMFAPVLTADGLCFTFNSLAAEEVLNLEYLQTKYPYSKASIPSRNWSPDVGYINKERESRERNPPVDRLYPRRGEERNLDKPDFYVVLGDPFPRDTLCSRTTFQGFKVALHHPAELPHSSYNFYATEANQRISFRIKVNVVTTSDTLSDYPPHVRQCYFPSEKTLKYFKVYTSNNCKLECIANHTLEHCGCVWFHMPRNDSTPICSSVEDIACFTKALGIFATSETWLGEEGCQCLQPCHNVQYDAEVFKTNYNLKTLSETSGRAFEEIDRTGKSFAYKKAAVDKLYTEIEMYFKTPRLVTLRRSELFGPTDFLANCGGLLGLFLGFSILSLVELVYFFTLRLYYVLRRQNKPDENGNAVHAAHANEQTTNVQTLYATRL